MASRKRRRIRRAAMVLAVMLALAGAVWWGNNRIGREDLEVRLDGLPEAFDGFRVVQISDLHGKQFGPDNVRLLEAVRAARPDMIAVTGDLIDDGAQLAGVEKLAKALSAIAPTYYVTGNHEWAVRKVPELIRLLEAGGVKALREEYEPVVRSGESIVVAGIDDPNGPKDQKTLEQTAAEIRSRYGDPFILLLAHRNDVEKYAACDIPLTLCGHAHGGVVRIPGVGGLLGTERDLFPEYTNGLYRAGDSTVMVSRGLGNVGKTLRLFNPPHLPVLILRRG